MMKVPLLFLSCMSLAVALWCGPLLKADGSQIPAVLFAGSDGGGHEVANQLVQAGFALRADHASLSEHPLAWSQVANFNAVVLSGLGQANADMSLGRSRETIDVLNRYLEAGGGVLMLGAFGQMATVKPPQDAFLKPLGLTPLFDGLPDDPKTAVRLDGRLQLALCVHGREVHRQEWMHDRSRHQLRCRCGLSASQCRAAELWRYPQPLRAGRTQWLHAGSQQPATPRLRRLLTVVRQGMVRLTAQSSDPDLLAAAFSAGGGRATLVILNRSVRPAVLKLDWPNVRLTTLELADPYHQNAVQPLPARPAEVTVAKSSLRLRLPVPL